MNMQEDYNALLEQSKWYHALVSVLVELEGGVVRLDREVVEQYDLNGNIRIWVDEAADQYVISISVDGETDE